MRGFCYLWVPMSVSAELLAVLACPKCKTPMAPDGKLRLDDERGGFVCDACQLLYRIEDDIPNFLIDEAVSTEQSA